MDKLKSILASKKQAARQVAGDRKWLKRAEREEFELRGPASPPKRAKPNGDGPPAAEPAPAPVQPAPELTKSNSTREAELLDLPVATVKRRLRRLGQPVTLFGEDAIARKKRLLHAARTVVLPDDEAGAGDGANVLINIMKEDKRKASLAQPQAAAHALSKAAGQPTDATGPETEAGTEEESLMRHFREAAARLKQQRELQGLKAEQRIVKVLQGYMAEWKADLDARPPEAVNTTVGLQATNGYRQTERSFEQLYARLAADEVHHEIKACLVMIIDALEQRQYQRANEVYLQLSIGNQQWPIGVTSIGIHARKAREKLSCYANEKSQAHIMNDEATRKYLHGVSRLIKAVQGLRPTDPSRSVNFNAVQHPGLGAKGGQLKEQYLALKAAGDTWQDKGLAEAPHFLDDFGSVAVPKTWGNMLRAQETDGQ